MKILVNPIDASIEEAIDESSFINIAVPFLSAHTVKRLFDKGKLKSTYPKQILIKLDDRHSITYDLDAVKHLLSCGFEIRFDNSIHLKLYILGSQVFISSGNLTEGGFKNNFELTVRTTDKESAVSPIFEMLWSKNEANKVTIKYVQENWGKYLLLKKKFPKDKMSSPVINVPSLLPSEEKLIETVLNDQRDWGWHYKMTGFVQKKRNNFANKLKTKGFKQEYFYAPEGDKNRKTCLFYEFVYGNEEKLAGTGLREAQFKDVFTDPNFDRILFYLFPQHKSPDILWNFEDKSEYLLFCKGLFEFDVRSFKEALPVRLANYFYPDHFLPIFNLTHLEQICNILGFECSAKDRATRLCEFNLFLKERLIDLPFNSFVKSTILYRLLYVLKVKKEIELHGSLNIEKYIASQRKEWVRNNMIEGLRLIKEIERE